MAERKMLVHLNMDGNQILNAGFEQLATNPVTDLFVGRQYWNTTTDKPFAYNGTVWIDLTAGLVVSSTVNALTVDNATAGQSILTIAVANGTDAGLMSNTNFTLLGTSTDVATNSAIVQRNATGGFAATAVTGLSAPIAGTDAANKTYVDTLVNSGMSVKGSIDCSTNPDYPAAIIGDAYYVSADGRIGGAVGEVVATGDLILCTADNAGGAEASVGNSWMVLERNLDVATDTVAGYVRLATAGEVSAGVATDVVPTIADVSTMVNNATGAKIFVQKLTAGATTYTVTHTLGGTVNTQVFDKSTGDVVGVDISRVDGNSITVTMNNALATDHIVMCNFAGVEPA